MVERQSAAEISKSKKARPRIFLCTRGKLGKVIK
jgi:hypothetical protein